MAQKKQISQPKQQTTSSANGQAKRDGTQRPRPKQPRHSPGHTPYVKSKEAASKG